MKKKVFILVTILSRITILNIFLKDFVFPVFSDKILYLNNRVLYYNAYIKPHFEYCCTTWGNSFDYNLYQLGKLHSRVGGGGGGVGGGGGGGVT